MAGYATSHITTLFGISPQTVRNWSMEFSRYLSTMAAPGRGRNRFFSEEDMRVFSLIAAMKKDGSTNDDIHASLASGQRGGLPELLPEQVQTLVMSDHAQAVQTLKQQIELLQNERAGLFSDLQAAKEEIIQLRSSFEGRLKDRDEQLRAAQEKIDKLNREIGRLESRIDDND